MVDQIDIVACREGHAVKRLERLTGAKVVTELDGLRVHRMRRSTVVTERIGAPVESARERARQARAERARWSAALRSLVGMPAEQAIAAARAMLANSSM